MQKLWLKYKDEDGTENRIEVARELFTVGRHSECTLVSRDSRLSREHLRIERDGGEFIAVDPGSSNGTTVNGQKLSSPRSLKDGDALDLGGGLQIAVEVEESVNAVPSPVRQYASLDPASPDLAAAGPAASVLPTSAAPASADGAGIPAGFFIFAPLLAILVLAVVVGAVVLFGVGGGNGPAESNDIGYASDDEDKPSSRGDGDEDDVPKPSRSPSPAASGTPADSGPDVSPSPSGRPPDVPLPGDMDEVRKIERNAAGFLKQIAENDSNPFITGEQARRVNAKIKQISRNPSLAENIRSAKAGAARIKSLGTAKNLNPYFLAVAGITKLGNSRGGVAEAVDGIVGPYDQLAVHNPTSLADDVLLLVAAFDQGVAGENTKLRDTIEALGRKDKSTPPREIRSIWYLEKAGKLTPADVDRVLTFLAIGTIAQNPKDFGVNTEPLRL